MNKALLSPSALFLLLPVASFAMGVQVMIDGRAVVFTDVPQSAWFAVHVREAAEAGIVNGYKDEKGNLTGKFGPGNDVTFAEALKIAVEGAGYDDELYGSRFSSGVQHWSSSYVSVAKGENFAVMSDRFRLNEPATRAEVASMMTSAFRVNLEDVSLSDRYKDVSMKTTFAEAIEALSRDRVVSGDTDIEGQATGTFRPEDPIRRSEVAKIVMLARATYGTPGVGIVPEEEEGGMQTEGNVVTYTSAGFSPQVLRIKKGESVTFKNDSTATVLVASDPHPSHTALPSFEADDESLQGGAFIYTFTQIGSWGYHNHMSPSHRGTIIVE